MKRILFLLIYLASLVPQTIAVGSLVSITSTSCEAQNILDIIVPNPYDIQPILPGYTSAWGTLKFNPDYEGYAVQVRRLSDDDTTSILLGINGKCDVETFNTFVSGGLATITKLYDQTGDYDLTVEAGFLEPYIFYDEYEDNLIISMEAATATSLINTSFPFNTRTLTTYSIARGNKESTSTETYFNYGTNHLLYYRSTYNQRTIFDNSNRNLANRQILDATDFTVHSVRSGASNVEITVDNIYNETVTVVSNLTSTGFRVGRWPGSATLDSKQDFCGWISYASVLSDVDDEANIDALLSRFNKSTDYNTLVVCLGNSITKGRQPINTRTVRTDQNWVIQLKRNYNDSILFINSGEGGNTVSQINTAVAARANNLLALGTYDLTIAIVEAGTNDIAAGTSPATIDANLSTLVGNLKSGGYDLVYVCTIIPRALSGGNETNRQSLNALILANTYADGVIDVNGNAGLILSSADYVASESPNFIHLNPDGNTKFMLSVEAYLNSILGY